MIESVLDFVFILREVHFELGPHVERDQRDVVLRFQVREKRGGQYFAR